jgi:UV DNA damage endonuclease
MNLSLCCISNTLSDSGKKFQTMTYSRFSQLGKEKALPILSERILNNLLLTAETIRFCGQNGISGYRLSSSLTPLLDHPAIDLHLEDLPNFSEIERALQKIRSAISETGVRISSHPSEYVSLSSESESVSQNSIRDLESHGELYERIGLPRNYQSPINIHVRKDGDVKTVAETVLKNVDRLSESVRSRLVFEVNDNQNGDWSITNLHKHFFQTAGIPVTFDSLHRTFLNHGKTEEEDFHLAYSTWSGFVPVFHYSESADGTRKHADMPQNRPNYYGREVYFDVELKGKDRAIFKIMGRI